MKKPRVYTSLLIASLLGVAFSINAQTQVWWDNNGTSAATSGTWDTTSTNWASSATLTASTSTFASNDFAIFAAGSGTTTALTITVPGAIGCEGIGNGTTDTGTASGAAITTLTFGGSGSISLPSGSWPFECGASTSYSMIFNLPITGTGGIAQHNSGNMQLLASNSYSGGTTATGGQVIYYNNNASFGTGPISVTGGSVSLVISGSPGVLTLTNPWTINNGGAVVNFGSGDTICSGAWTLQSLLQLKDNSGTLPLTISGPISGAFGVELQNNNATSVGAGTITFSGANTYTGQTAIGSNAVGGITTLSVSSINSVSSPQASSSLGVPSSAANGVIAIGNTSYGCAMIYTGAGETSDRGINLCGTTGTVTLEMDGVGPLNITGPITATGAGSKTLTLQGTSTTANTLGGGIPNNSSANKTSLTKAQAGTWYLGGANSFTGNITISAGTLGLNGSGTLGSGSYAGTIANSGVFIYNSSASQTLSGVISGAGTLTNMGPGSLTLTATETMTGAMAASGGVLSIGSGSANGNLGGNVSTAGNGYLVWNPSTSVTYSKVISGAGNLVKNGSGTLVIGGNANTFTYGGGSMPAAIINGGILQTGGDQTSGGKAANLGTTPSSVIANNIVLNGGTLQGNNPNFAFMANRGITLLANSGISAITNGNGQFPVQGEMGIQGVITDTSAGNGGAGPVCGITVTGQTNLTTHLTSGVYLEGINTYYGPTVVQSGILSLYYNGSIQNSSSLTINSGAAFDVSSNSLSTWNLNQPLIANGTGLGWPGYETPAPSSAAILIGFNNGLVNLGNQPLYLTITPTNFTGESTQPALYVSQGNVGLNGNLIYVTNNAATPLGPGTYTLMQLAPGNSISVSGAPTLAGGTVYGNGIAGGNSASLVVNGGSLNLVVAPPGGGSTPYFFNVAVSTPTFTYGSANSVTVTGTVSNTTGGVAVNGDTVSVNIGGLGTQTVTAFDASGDFTLAYSLPALTPAGYTPASNYVVVCTYSGALGSATDSSASLDITPAPLIVSVSAQDKIYSGNTSVTYTLMTNAAGDVVTLGLQPSPNLGVAAFASPNVGTGITVTVGPLEITGGANAGNWYLPVANDTATTTASIYTTTQTWNGGDYGTSPDWSDANNWVGSVAPDLIGDTLTFTGAVGPMPVMQNPYTNWSLIFDSGATTSFNITNLGTGVAALSMGAGGISNLSAVTQTISVPVSNLSSYSSQWYVTGGSTLMMISNVSDAGGGITLNGTGSLTLAGSNNAITGPLTNSGVISLTGGAKLNNGSYAGAINNNNSLVFNSTSNQTFSGVISGGGTLTQNGTGTLTLGNANTYSGMTTIGNGSLVIGSDASLGAAPGSFVANQLYMNCNINPSSGVYNDYGLRDTGGNFTLNANRGITLGPLGGSVNIQSGYTMMIAGVISGNGPFYACPNASAGYGTTVLAAANTYTGPTFIGAGTLAMATSGVLPFGTPLTIASATNGTGGSWFNMSNFDQTIGPLASSTGLGVTGNGTPTIEQVGNLTILETNVNTTFAGVISTGTPGNVTVSVPVGGTGSELTLTGTNTYGGVTTINAGATLGLAGKGAISNSASITLGAGGTFDASGLTAGVFNLSSVQTLTASGTGLAPATINGGASGTVNLGAQGITLNFTPTAFSGDSANPALTVSQGTLSVNGNAITVNNTSGTPLGNGTYVLVQTANPITVAAAPTLAGGVVGGAGIGTGGSPTASVSVSGNNIILTVSGIVTGPPPSPTITLVKFVSPGVLSLSSTNGTPNGPYRLMESTTLSIPVTNWNVVETGFFDNSGNLSITYTNNPADTQEFFSIQNP